MDYESAPGPERCEHGIALSIGVKKGHVDQGDVIPAQAHVHR